MDWINNKKISEKRKRKIHNFTSPLPSKKSIERLGKILFYIIYVVGYSFSAYTFFTKDAITTELDCGKVEKLFERYTYSSDGKPIGKPELTMVFKSDKTGFREINVSDNTYYGTQKGSRVCFNVEKENGWLVLNAILFVLCSIGIIQVLSQYISILWSKLPD